MDNLDKMPVTVDGQGVWPGMPVYIMSPYSTKKANKATVYCVLGENEPGGGYYVVLEENRYCDGYGMWDDGNTEHISKVYADEEKCLQAANKIYTDWLLCGK